MTDMKPIPGKYTPPEEEDSDVAYAAARAITGLIPLGADFLDWLIGSPLERRRDDWRHHVAKGLRDLEQKKSVSLTELQDNNQFIDVVLTATRIAMYTSQGEKLDALRNAVLNSALPESPDETWQFIFLRWIDELTPWHLRMLKFYQHPRRALEERGVSIQSGVSTSTIISPFLEAYQDMRGKAVLFRKIWKDLAERELVLVLDDIESAVKLSVSHNQRTSKTGNRFLQYIESPVKDE